MMRVRENGLAAGVPVAPGLAPAPRQRQNDSRSDGSAGPIRVFMGRITAPIRSLAYAAMQLLMVTVAKVYFGHVRVIGRERFPRHGPVLVASNHPAAWTDVLALDVALGRKLHFLAHDELFHPWARRALLALYGALPVRRRSAPASGAAINPRTFAACHRLFDRGQAVAVFPEGVSLGDRGLQPLKTGAARLLLEHPPSETPPELVPVGLHYEDRTAFRRELTVAVGEPIPLDTFREAWQRDPEPAVHALTATLRAALERVILELDDPQLAALVPTIVSLDPARAAAGGPSHLERSRAVATCLKAMRRDDPRGFADLARRARAYRRLRRAMHVPDRLLRVGFGRRAGALGAALVLGAAPAALGTLVNGAPYWTTGLLARAIAPEPPRVSFAKIGAGILMFGAAYTAGLAWLLALGHPLWRVAIELVAAAGLGFVALAYGGALRESRAWCRLIAVARAHPGTLGRVRALRASLAQAVDGAAGVLGGRP